MRALKAACVMTALFCLCALSGCAAPQASAPAASESAYQVVRIDTPGVEGSSCIVQDGVGSYRVMAPGQVSVRRTPQAMTVNCFKGEHMRGMERVAASFAPREAQAMNGCVSCTYPATVRVAMLLNDSLMDVPKLRMGP